MEKKLPLDQREEIDRLRKLREDLGYTQDQFAEILEINSETYKKIERYDRRISLNNFKMLRRKMSFSVDYILSGGDESQVLAWYGEIHFPEKDSRVCLLRLLRYLIINCPEIWPMIENKDMERLDEVICTLTGEQSAEGSRKA